MDKWLCLRVIIDFAFDQQQPKHHFEECTWIEHPCIFVGTTPTN